MLPFWTSLSLRSPWIHSGQSLMEKAGASTLKHVIPLRTPGRGRGALGVRLGPCQRGRGRKEERCGTSVLPHPLPSARARPSAALWPAECRPFPPSLRWVTELG